MFFRRIINTNFLDNTLDGVENKHKCLFHSRLQKIIPINHKNNINIHETKTRGHVAVVICENGYEQQLPYTERLRRCQEDK